MVTIFKEEVLPMEVQPRREMQQQMVGLEMLQPVKQEPVVDQRDQVRAPLAEHLTVAGHLKVAVEVYLRVAQVLPVEVMVRHLVATVALRAP